MSKARAFPICGFIGLGSQGAPIARRIIGAGYSTVLWARRAQTLESFEDSGAVFARSVTDLGRQADHVGICVTDDAAVTAVCEELLPAMRPGSIVAIHSTTHPHTCQEIARQASARNLGFVEAPVSGGAPAAAAGTLTLMTAGSSETLAKARPIFSSFANLILHLGEVGSGQAAKLINNTLMVANLGLADSALAAANELGLDRKAMLELFHSSSARSFALEVYARQSSLARFSNYSALLEKVQLLGTLLGERNPAFSILRAAAHVNSVNE